MGLDVTLTKVMPTEIYSANITHNLNKMAEAAGIYEAVWRPEEHGYTHAKDIIEILESGINKMKENPDYYKTFNAPNGWGTYGNFLPWLEKYLEACKKDPDAEIQVSR